MADYFTNFSFQVRLPDAAAQAYALALAERARRAQATDPPTKNVPAALRPHLDDWCFEVRPDLVDHQPGLWLRSQDGGVEAVCAFVQHLLQKFALRDKVGFEWSQECSKPQLDAFGGGAAVITARRIKTFSTYEWLCRHTGR